MSDGDVKCDLGIWLASGVRNVPRGDLVWQGIPRRVYSASIGKRPAIATVRRAIATKQWAASMAGFVWDVTGDRGSSTTKALKITTSPVRAFPSSTAAKHAVEEAFRCLPPKRCAV